MNFLELVKRTARECGVASAGITSTAGRTGESQLIVDWVAAAWLEIQGLHDSWKFMREPFTFQTSATLADYTVFGTAGIGAGLTHHRYWHTDTFRIYKTALGVVDEQWLVEWNYGAFRDAYRFGLQTSDRPAVFAVKPKGAEIMLGPVPNDTYTIAGEYQRAPTDLVGDDSEPDIPSNLHLVIVFKAMESYGLYHAAAEVIARADRQYKVLLAQLEREQLPEIFIGGSLA